MREVVIASGARTAIGRSGGTLSGVPAIELGEIVIRELLLKAKIRPEKVDELIMGNVLQAGLGRNPAGVAAARAGISQYSPSLTVSKVCGAGMKAVIMAAQTVKSGDADIVVAGGMENMSAASNLFPQPGQGDKGNSEKVIDPMIRDGIWCSFGNSDLGTTLENIGETFNVSRAEQDKYAANSHQKAQAAITNGRFSDEIVPVRVPQEKGDPVVFDTDENPRFDTDVEKLAKLKPTFSRDGTITAGNSSGIADGASALLIMSAERAFKMGIRPMAKIVGYDYHWCEPELMGYGPIYAVRGALHKMRGKLDKQIDLVELNETFAAQTVVSIRELNLDPEIVNVNGGAIALGHPIGSSGARILTTLLYEMQRRDVKVGLAAGMGIACVVERDWYF
ncbi:MAG: acetyl-CoA C-acetyltransferase [Deltaproteobacteria bacterium]|nr:MAG: acetyl-CoA C-acetyltransferase [Deltaproteobacteria bacterium]